MSKLIDNSRVFLSSHRTFFLATGGIVILLLLTILTLPKGTLESLHSPVTPTSSPSSQGTNDPARHALPQGEAGRQSPTPIPPPYVSFESYENRSAFPVVPQSINTYILKTNYTVEEARSFGSKFGMNEVKGDDPKFVVMSNLTDMNNRGMLLFDRETGGFQFQSWVAYTLDSVQKVRPLGRSDLVQNAQSYLTDLGIIDPTVSCPITYQKQGLTGVTYVECHRDWTKVGGTILNFIGLLNVPEDTSLASLSLGKPSTYTPDDPTIINTSDNSNGKARLTDFNTLTVGVADDGRILTIDSNLRTIVQASTVVNAQLLTPEEALTQLTANSQQQTAKLSLTIPAGSGSVDWNKVYPGNLAKGKKAIITDYLLTYLEKPGLVSQNNLVPMYVIRGTAELASGYTVRFTETVPAMKSSLSFLEPREGNVAGIKTSLLAQNDDSIKLGTFQPTIITPPTDSSSNPLPSVTGGESGGASSPTPGGPSYSFAGCKDFNVGEKAVMKVPGLGEITFRYAVPPFGIGGIHVYFFQSATFPVKDIAEVKELFFQLIEDQYLINISRAARDMNFSLDSLIANLPESASEETKQKQLMNAVIQKVTGGDISFGLCTGYLVPIPPYCEDKPNLFPEDGSGQFPTNWYYFDFKIVHRVYVNVEKKLYDIYKQHSLSDWQTKENIFPASSPATSWLLINMGLGGGSNTYSQCYVSGNSPSLYLYPQSETKVNIHLPSSLSFSYPSAQSGVWNILAKPNGTLSLANNQKPMANDQLSRLYYGYDKSKVTFTEPKEGFVIKKDEWEGFITNILAPKLGLTEKETDDLVTDVRNALVDIKDTNYSYLKISLADPKEVNEKLPVTISPKPDSFYRIHLILTPQNSTITLRQPTITPIRRNGFTAVEVGARVP